MSSNRIGLIALSALVLGATATAVLAQQNPFLNPLNPATPLLNGMTLNPIPSTANSALPPPHTENPVSPAPTTGLLPNTTGTNPLTGLPCTGPGALSISGVGGLPGATAPPLNGSPQTANSATPQLPAFPSVFQSGNTSGAC